VLSQEIPDTLIKRMMVTTGTVSSLNDLKDNLQNDIFRFTENPAPEDSELVKSVISYVFNIDSLIHRYIKNFSQLYNEDKVNKILDVYKNEIYIKATQLEARNVSDEEIEKYANSFNITEIPASRLNLIKRLIAAAGIQDFSYYALKLTLQLAMTVNNAISGLDETDYSGDIIDKMLSETEPEMNKFIIIILVNCYKELNDDELEEYVEYYESPLGKWHMESSIVAYLNTISQSADIFISSVHNMAKSRKI
jgi:hypothetical protein